uniref:Mitochondrial import inner membrane translocase subunit TIM50 n=1 Tax=Oryza barthii TaxID=65489 RepID=A0A0D3FP87_9ORYZ
MLPMVMLQGGGGAASSSSRSGGTSSAGSGGSAPPRGRSGEDPLPQKIMERSTLMLKDAYLTSLLASLKITRNVPFQLKEICPRKQVVIWKQICAQNQCKLVHSNENSNPKRPEVKNANSAGNSEHCMLDTRKTTDHDTSSMPLQDSRFDANVRIHGLHSTTEERVCQSTVGDGFTGMSNASYNPYSVQENQRIGPFMREPYTLHSHFLHPSHVRGYIGNKFMGFPPVHPMNAFDPFNQGFNFFHTGNIPPYGVSDVHRGLNIYGLSTMGKWEYNYGRHMDYTNVERNELRMTEEAYLSTHNSANFIRPSSLPLTYQQKPPITLLPRVSLTGFRKKKLLILDLNGLLADINQDYHNSHMADAKNVDSVIDIIMRDFKPLLQFCWDMSKCTFTGHKTLENIHKPLVLKELRKLWNKEEPDLPWEQGYYSPSNTLLVDDSPYKALRNPPYTAIFPQPYSYLNSNDNSLGPGGDLRVYLENLTVAEDVECYVRNNPFGQPFITQSDPHWSFYAQIAS